MSYREENGQVVLTMSREDYNFLLLIFAATTKMSLSGPMGNVIVGPERIIGLLNRLNEGNPNYRPYEVAEKYSPRAVPKDRCEATTEQDRGGGHGHNRIDQCILRREHAGDHEFA